MVTFAQAQERAEEWVNGEVPAYQHRAVRVREFGLGFVVWSEDREGGPVVEGGRQRLVIARDSGDVTLWPGIAVGEVIRRFEEEYGAQAAVRPAPEPPARIDLNQTSFLLTPPEWLQDAADKLGIPDRRGEARAASGPSAGEPADGVARRGSGVAPPDAPAFPPVPEPDFGPVPSTGPGAGPVPSTGAGSGPAAGPVPVGGGAATTGSGAWAGTDTNAASDSDSVPLPATVFAPPLSGADDGSGAPADAPTALLDGGSQLPPTAVAPSVPPVSAGASAAPVSGQGPGNGPNPPVPGPPGPPGPQGAPPALPDDPSASDIAHAPTSKATPPPRRGGVPTTPPPPGVPGTPGGYVATQFVASLDGPPQPPGPPGPPGPPSAPGVPGTPGAHHAATVFADPQALGGPPPPPAPPGVPGVQGQMAGQMPGVQGGAAGSVPGPVPQAGQIPPPAYGYPPAPAAVPTVGPGYQAVLRYRAPDGSEAQLIRRSAPGTPHPEWQILHELRALNVPPQQVLELHTELESCELPGAYCARMIREMWPQVRITSVAPYGQDHASRQQGMQHLLTHQGELHQVADGPARPAPVRAPLPQVPAAPAVPPEAIQQEMLGAFGPQGLCRYDQQAVSRQGVPEVVAQTLVWAGLPADFGPFFWAQPAQPVIPTLAEVAAQRQVAAASDASSYLVVGTDFGRALCVQYGTAHIMAVPVEAGPGGAPGAPQFVNSSLPQFARCMAMLGRMWRLRFGLTPEQAGRWTVDFQAQLAALDPAALSSPESWWSVLLEQMWDGLL
ncbi:SUKH-4 family immunity protein [Streptomyces sp. NBC_01497]|uniref:SUKH-4 family immunity protein n=1 Tax=Streptomyces sp. NBC_01497 TaxID=2903885 RepID=UPI002E33F51C|nr:SUKH-4 family immunity protein [Streptomyces sp. NBC_01497]